MPSQFVKGSKYTRADVAAQIDLPSHRRSGGNWVTGYDTWNEEAFIFCNVGVAGRTGHNYPNEWAGKELVWYGKTGTHQNQKLIRKLTGAGMPVHIFWRSTDRDAFVYAGQGRAVEVSDSSPVRVRWRFHE